MALCYKKYTTPLDIKTQTVNLTGLSFGQHGGGGQLMMNYDWSTLPENVHDVNGYAESDGQRACPSAREQGLTSGALEENPDSEERGTCR